MASEKLLLHCLEWTKQLANKQQEIVVEIKVGDFKFSFNNKKINQHKSPSQLKRNFERRKAFEKKFERTEPIEESDENIEDVIKSETSEEKIVCESYVKETRVDGNVVFCCKQCKKETRTEGSMKAHIKSKHSSQSLKRVNSGNQSLNSSNQQDDIKKARFERLASLEEFEFDSNMASSTQSEEAFDRLNQTVNICERYVAKSNYPVSDANAVRSSADEIVARWRRSASSVEDLINLEESLVMSHDQDHKKSLL